MFQRPYVWSAERQWKPLFEDLILVTERFLAESELGVVNNQQPEERTPRHFLGAVVVDQPGSQVGSVDRRLVIDGQQRLTTLQILLTVVRQHAELFGEGRSAAQLRRLVENGEEVVDPARPEERWKVWPTNADRDDFVQAMLGEDGSGGSRFAVARRFFSESMSDWLNSVDESARPDHIRAAAAVLQSHFEVVAVELERDDNAQVIFETLNDRGAPLLAADLVKNHIFQNLSEPTQADRLYEEFWRPFDKDRWRQEVRQGRLRRPRIDVFLQHWLSLQMLNDVLATELFNTFKQLHGSGERSVERLLRELSVDSELFEALDTVMTDQPHSTEGTFVYRWRTLELTAFTPLLLFLFRSGVDEADRRRGLVALESWMVRRALCRSTSKDINRFALDLLAHLSKSSAPPGEQLERELAEAVADTRRWPSDNEVRASLLDQPIYGRVVQRRLAMVFEAIEDQMRSERHVEQPAPRRMGLEIEHVMPKEWRTYWRPQGMGELDAQRRDLVVQQIGNLTLVTSKVNKLLTNHPWLEQEAAALGVAVPRRSHIRGKQNVLGEHSVLLLNQDLCGSSVTEWSEKRISERSRAMTERILVIWRRPQVEDGWVDLEPSWDAAASAMHTGPLRRSVARQLSNVPEGTVVEFRRSRGTVHNGTLVVDDVAYKSPSAAGSSVTHGSHVNGWIVWKTAAGKTLAELHDGP